MIKHQNIQAAQQETDLVSRNFTKQPEREDVGTKIFGLLQ